jgi:hypothetical protein
MVAWMVRPEVQIGRYLDGSLQKTCCNRQSVRLSQIFLAGAQIQAATRLHCKRDGQTSGFSMPANAAFKQMRAKFACLLCLHEKCPRGKRAPKVRRAAELKKPAKPRVWAQSKNWKSLWFAPTTLTNSSTMVLDTSAVYSCGNDAFLA